MKRTIQLNLTDDKDLRNTLKLFRKIQCRVSAIYFDSGRPLSAIELHRIAYDQVKGSLKAQMTCSAIRMVASVYSQHRRKYGEIVESIKFNHNQALFLIGEKKRDAGFLKDGSLTIWTTGGRKKIYYSIPSYFKELFETSDHDTLLVSEDRGELRATLVVTAEAPEPKGELPVGLYVNRQHDLVAVTSTGRSMRVSGTVHRIATSIASKRHKRLQNKLISKLEAGKDTRSLRRQLGRIGRKSRRRTALYCREAANYVVGWLPAGSVLVFQERDDLEDPIVAFIYNAMRQAVEAKAEAVGVPVEFVSAPDADVRCSQCGMAGRRISNVFVCASCGQKDSVDRNAAQNIRGKFTALRSCGLPPASPEAPQVGKHAGKIHKKG